MMKTRAMAPPTLKILFIILTLAVAFAGVAAEPMAAATIGATTRVSVASDGTQGNGWSSSPSISSDGRYVAFVSDASNLVPGIRMIPATSSCVTGRQTTQSPFPETHGSWERRARQ